MVGGGNRQLIPQLMTKLLVCLHFYPLCICKDHQNIWLLPQEIALHFLFKDHDSSISLHLDGSKPVRSAYFYSLGRENVRVRTEFVRVVKYTKWPRINMTWQSGFLLKFDACCYWKWSLRRHFQIMMLAITNQDWLPNSSVQFRFFKKTSKFDEISQSIRFQINWKISSTFCELHKKPGL